MLSSKEKQLYECVKKLAPKVRHKCGLKNVEIDDLIQAGCIACLNEQTPQNEWPAVAKKAMLKWYYKEREWQQKTKTRDITIGKGDNDKHKNLVEDVIAAKNPRTVKEQADYEKTVKEWEDVEKLPLPSDLKAAARYFYNLDRMTAADRTRRKRVLRSCREITQGTAEELEAALYTAKINGVRRPRKAFKTFMLRRAKLPCNEEWLDKAKAALNCPVCRKALQMMFLPEELERLIDTPPLNTEYEYKQKEYQKKLYQKRIAFLAHYGFKHTKITYLFIKAYPCPLMLYAIKKHIIQRQHPELMKRPKVHIDSIMPLIKRGKRYEEWKAKHLKK